MAEFAYNNSKNTSTSYTPFELNCGYYPWMSYKEEANFCSQSKLAEKLSAELREMMIVCRENFYYIQKLQKRAHNKRVKPRRYASGEKVWLNSKYNMTKYNQKLETKFFRPFQVFHLIGKKVYKLELFRNWRIYDIFYMSLLE